MTVRGAGESMLGVGLIRGINVGPTTGVSMADLAASFEAAGLLTVKTLLRSGNVVFEAPGGFGASETACVEHEIEARSGVAARALLLSADEFVRMSNANPLLEIADDPSKLVVTYLAEPPDATTAEIPEAALLAPEVLRIGREAIYQWCPLGVSNSKLTPRFWRQFGPMATTRNWRTVLRIIQELDAR